MSSSPRAWDRDEVSDVCSRKLQIVRTTDLPVQACLRRLEAQVMELRATLSVRLSSQLVALKRSVVCTYVKRGHRKDVVRSIVCTYSSSFSAMIERALDCLYVRTHYRRTCARAFVRPVEYMHVPRQSMQSYTVSTRTYNQSSIDMRVHPQACNRTYIQPIKHRHVHPQACNRTYIQPIKHHRHGSFCTCH